VQEAVQAKRFGVRALVTPEHPPAHGLSSAEKDLISRRDWRAMIHYGAIFFVLEKLAAVVGISNLHVYTAMRGEDKFQKTRSAAIHYGVSR
jgi:gallate dioxygenase